ncbi:hypothetical protein [Burkholderia sp. Leaf177]|uniref:hypothetical protein n=1 Tax=Burkholderia sp. Leaf177 TaxID=1736287 RepID=UPI0012E3A0AB|nr:hypothetical protein [Burkholderia sp. Leaf177]
MFEDAFFLLLRVGQSSGRAVIYSMTRFSTTTEPWPIYPGKADFPASLLRRQADDRPSNLGNQIGGVLAVRRIEDAHFGTAGFIGGKEARGMKCLSGLVQLLIWRRRRVISSSSA